MKTFTNWAEWLAEVKRIGCMIRGNSSNAYAYMPGAKRPNYVRGEWWGDYEGGGTPFGEIYY